MSSGYLSAWLAIKVRKQAYSQPFPILHSFVYSYFAQMLSEREQGGCGDGRVEFELGGVGWERRDHAAQGPRERS